MVEVTTIDSLGLELLKVANAAPKGSHFDAARRMNITPDAEMKVRQRKLWKKDTASNHQKMRQLIHIYKVITGEHQEETV